MSDDALGIYLNDHFAGSVGAVQMVERTIKDNEGSLLARRLEEVLREIRKDQAVLEELIDQVGAGADPVKKAGAWLAEKAGRLKLGRTNQPGDLSRLEVLETLAMGIQGKRALWRALRVVRDKHPAAHDLDLDTLERRAVDQHDRVEEWRLEAAREVL